MEYHDGLGHPSNIENVSLCGSVCVHPFPIVGKICFLGFIRERFFSGVFVYSFNTCALREGN